MATSVMATPRAATFRMRIPVRAEPVGSRMSCLYARVGVFVKRGSGGLVGRIGRVGDYADASLTRQTRPTRPTGPTRPPTQTQSRTCRRAGWCGGAAHLPDLHRPGTNPARQCAEVNVNKD